MLGWALLGKARYSGAGILGEAAQPCFWAGDTGRGSDERTHPVPTLPWA